MKNRKVAVCIDSWGSEESVRLWVWLKKRILQAPRGQTFDELHIIHVKNRGQKSSGPRWDSGGPLLPDVRTAASGFNVRVEELEGTPGSAIVEYVNKEEVDCVVMGNKGRNNIRRTVMGSTTEYVLRRVKCACLIVRPKVGVGDSYRLKAAAQPATGQGALSPKSQPGSPSDSAGLAAGLAQLKSAGRTLSVKLGVTPGSKQKQPDPTAVGGVDVRRLAIVFDTIENGRSLMQYYQANMTRSNDTVFAVQWKPWPLTSQLRSDQLSTATPELGALVNDSLGNSAYSHHLQGDKSSIISFVSKEAIDLLVIARNRTRSARKALTGRQICSYLYHTSGCPCLVVPLGPVAGADNDSDSDVDSADEGGAVMSSDDDLGPLPSTAPRRARSLSPGRPDLPIPGQATSVVSSLQMDLQRYASDANLMLKGFKELLVHLDDAGRISSISPLVRHQMPGSAPTTPTSDTSSQQVPTSAAPSSASPAAQPVSKSAPSSPAHIATISAPILTAPRRPSSAEALPEILSLAALPTQSPPPQEATTEPSKSALPPPSEDGAAAPADAQADPAAGLASAEPEAAKEVVTKKAGAADAAVQAAAGSTPKASKASSPFSFPVNTTAFTEGDVVLELRRLLEAKEQEIAELRLKLEQAQQGGQPAAVAPPSQEQQA